MTRLLSVGSLLALPVTLNGIELGRPVDALVEVERLRVVGLTVRSTDDVMRFLPFAAARVRDDAIEVASALLLLEDDRFYRERGQELASLRGRPVLRGRTSVGALAGATIGSDGEIRELLVDDGDDRVAIAVTSDVHLARPPRAA